MSFETMKDMHPECGLWLIPGDRIVSHAGVLLTMVTESRQIEGNDYVRINEGMGPLVRSALYGPHHEIVNFSKLGEKEMSAMKFIQGYISRLKSEIAGGKG